MIKTTRNNGDRTKVRVFKDDPPRLYFPAGEFNVFLRSLFAPLESVGFSHWLQMSFKFHFDFRQTCPKIRGFDLIEDCPANVFFSSVTHRPQQEFLQLFLAAEASFMKFHQFADVDEVLF